MASSSDLFELQLNIIDTINVPPNPNFDPAMLGNKNITIKCVPILRVFGTTRDGTHECLIIHGFMPKIYLECPQSPDEQPAFLEEITQYIDKQLGDQIVFNTSYVRKINIYGYQEQSAFLEMQILDPTKQIQLSQLLAVFSYGGRLLRVFNGHIPNFLQFLAEYNLTGCGYISISSFQRTEPSHSIYQSEVHCLVSAIVVKEFNEHSQILSHLAIVWDHQKEIRRDLQMQTQTAIVNTPREEVIFTQRIPKIEAPPQTQDLESLLDFLHEFDPDASVEKISREITQTQIEIENIMADNQPGYVTPTNFSEKRGAEQLSLSERAKSQLNRSFAEILTKNSIPYYYNARKIEPKIPSQKLLIEEIETSEDSSRHFKIMFIEVASLTRASYAPNPKFDSITCVAIITAKDAEIIDKRAIFVGKVKAQFQVVTVKTEADLLNSLTSFILESDPDIIAGYNTEKESLGYILKRAETLGRKNWFAEISRGKPYIGGFDECKKIEGRILINFWRYIRHKESFRDYTLETASFKLLQKRIPKISQSQAGAWMHAAPHRYVANLMSICETVFEIFFKENTVQSYCEQAYIIGIDFASVWSRGSQFMLESLFFRVASRLGYILYSPTKSDLQSQRAIEVVPLVMEPVSGFYSDPVLVIDFQSLYPSTMIAYNLCFSTIIGRSDLASTGGQLGCTNHRVDLKELQRLIKMDKVINTPNDVLFVDKSLRRGVLPILLEQILDLRAYIKKSMKKVKNPKIKSLLDSRQMSLKMFAACTYGYTNAGFSGRMPCVELADSIVECSRHVLEFTISHIQKFYPELSVLYGDTDSIFIKMPPANIRKCFEFADQLCSDITSLFPSPIRIKIEKIYKGCFLVNKKRYCGWMYESAGQDTPEFDAKGLEMKRRDTCLLVANCLKDIVEEVFRSQSAKNAEKIFKDYVSRVCYCMIPLNQFFFAKEVRLGTYRGLEPPGAIVARRRMEEDPYSEPLYGERVKYLVVASTPGSKLKDRVVSPEEYINKKLRIGAKYYIEKQILPALGRIMETMGVDVNKWMKGVNIEMHSISVFRPSEKKLTRMEIFCRSIVCPLCRNQNTSGGPICAKCLSVGGRGGSLYELVRRQKSAERIIDECQRQCSNCLEIPGATSAACFCDSCDIYWQTQLAEEQFAGYKSYINELRAQLQEK